VQPKAKYVIHDRFVSGANNIDKLRRTQTYRGTEESHRGWSWLLTDCVRTAHRLHTAASENW